MRFFKGPLSPQSELGRVIVAVLIAVFATIALLEWTPSGPPDAGAAKARRGAGPAAGG
jgi:hypothetical protein